MPALFAARKGRAVLSLCFADAAGRTNRKKKNSNCTRAVVMRIQVASVSRTPMAAVDHIFGRSAESLCTNR